VCEKSNYITNDVDSIFAKKFSMKFSMPREKMLAFSSSPSLFSVEKMPSSAVDIWLYVHLIIGIRCAVVAAHGDVVDGYESNV